jgi:hypothetical protein
MIIQSELSAEEFIEKLTSALADKITKSFDNPPEQFVPAEKIAEYFGVKLCTIYKWNRLGCPRTHSKPEKYKISQVEKWRIKIEG